MKNVFKENILNKKTENKEDEWEMINDNNWNPEIGDKIEGKLIAIEDKKIGEYDTQIYLLESEDSKQTRVWGCTYLNQLMEEIILGDYIRITYNGSKQTNNGHKMKLFNLERRIKHE